MVNALQFRVGCLLAASLLLLTWTCFGGMAVRNNLLSTIRDHDTSNIVDHNKDPEESLAATTGTAISSSDIGNYTTAVFLGGVNLSDSAFPLEDYQTLLYEPFRSDPCTPRRIHLSQKNNVHVISQQPPNFHNETTEAVVSMTVSFMLDFEKCASAKPKVIYRQGFHPELTVTPDQPPLQFNYTSSIVNNTDPFFQSDWIYHVTLPDVKAGSHRYWYRIEIHDNDNHNHNEKEASFKVDSSTTSTHDMLRLGRRRAAELASSSSTLLLGSTPEFSFLTPPLPNTPTSIALVGDLGQTINSTKTMAHIYHDSLSSNKNPTTLLLIAGDMAYADSDPDRWISWFDLMEPLTRSLTMHVAAGNHEIECDNSTLEIFQPYEHYFHNPNRIAKADLRPITQEYRESLRDNSCSTPSEFQGHYNYGNAFYSFQHGYVHFIILSSYSDTRKGKGFHRDSPQYKWLTKELKENVNRTATPWVIVSFHSPLYTTFRGHVDEKQSLQMKESMEPLFQAHGVNLVICGHDHGYMRTHSLGVNGTIDSTGKSPIYLTLGAGGNREQHSKGYRNETAPEDFVAMRDIRDFGYGNLLVTNATHAILNWVRDGVSEDGVDDKNVWLVNHHAPKNNHTNHSTIISDETEAWSDWQGNENGSSEQAEIDA